jgi:hypothetical protein
MQGSEWWDSLNVNEQQTVRTKVIDSINQYHDFVLDTIKASDGDMINDEVVSMVRQIRASQIRIENEF